MKPIQRILVGLDLDPGSQALSRGSRAALEQALWVAGRGEVAIDLAHSTATDSYIESRGAVYRLVHEGLSAKGREALEGASARVAEAGHGGRLDLHDEKPWIAMTRSVLQRGTDLVIVGRHDDGEVRGPLGSVSRKLIQKCPCAVWAVHGDVPTSPACILVGTDLSEVGAEALRWADELAQRSGGELHVVHAFQLPLAAEMVPDSSVEERMAGLREESLARVRDQILRAELESEPRVHVSCTTPYRGIRLCAERLEPHVLVLGTVSRGGLPGFLIGNTAEKVLRKLDYPLLTVKPPDFVTPIQ